MDLFTGRAEDKATTNVTGVILDSPHWRGINRRRSVLFWQSHPTTDGSHPLTVRFPRMSLISNVVDLAEESPCP